MDELLDSLDKKLRAFIDHYHNLKQANQQLYRDQTVVALDHSQVLAKQQKAIGQLETLIARLKTLEEVT